MRLRAVTFDFWSTLVDGSPDPERYRGRMARLRQLIEAAGHPVTEDELRTANRLTWDRLNARQRETLEDVGPPGHWAVLAELLGVPAGLIAYEVVEPAYEAYTLEDPQPTMPHVEEALKAMRAAGYQLAVICNTGLSGGQTLRQLLRHHGLLDYFHFTVWSNEFGFAKPDPRIFHHALDGLGGVPPSEALHVGDLEELDMEGARRAGLHCARYLPEAPDDLKTDADFLVRDWRDFPAQLASYLSSRSATVS